MIIAVFFVMAGAGRAQDDRVPPPEPTALIAVTATADPGISAQQVIEVTDAQPAQLTQGQGGTLTIAGNNFTADTTVALSRSGASTPLAATILSPTLINAAIDPSVAAGTYTIVVTNPTGTRNAPTPLTIVPPPLIVVGSEPSNIVGGQQSTLTVLGANFTQSTLIRLVGFGVLETRFINGSTITGTIPVIAPPGSYAIEVSDPALGTANAPSPLNIAPPPTATPLPTVRPDPTLAPTATVQSTPIPGQPELVVRNFVANPSAVAAGGTAQLVFEVVNIGNRTAQGVAVALGEGDFAPANGQASVTLPDLQPYGAFTMTLSVTAASNAPEGPNAIPLVLTSRDFSGQIYTDEAQVSVNVLAETPQAAQVVLSRYTASPSRARPGQDVDVEILLTNTGTEDASQVLVRLGAGETENVLIAGSQGSAFAMGDLAPGASASVIMPLVVAEGAEPGVRAQPFSITYNEEGEARELIASISLEIERVIAQTPLLLLQAYNVGQDDPLRPGQQFTLEMTLLNAGRDDASDLQLTFGEVQSSGPTVSGGNSTPSAPSSNGSSSSSTTPSTTFATYGSGGTLYVERIPAGETITLTQDFLVNGAADSSIYTMPITLRFRDSRGEEAQSDAPVSLIVVREPLVQTLLQNPIPESVMVGEPFPIALQLTNGGDDPVRFTSYAVSVEGGEVVEGGEAPLTILEADDDTTINALVLPTGDGPVRVQVAVNYVDDLSREEQIVLNYETTAITPPPEPTPDTTIIIPTPEAEPPAEDDMLGRLLLGLLGLGS